MTQQIPTNKLAVVVKGFPRLSETFIAQEIRNIEISGFDVTIFSLRHPTDKKRHPVHDEMTAEVRYLPEYLYQEPIRVLRGWLYARKQPGYKGALKIFLRDFSRDRTPNRIRRFGQSLVMAREIPQDISALYAHFLHTPSSVTRYCSLIRNIPWAASAHAKDIYTSPDWELSEKLEHCQWLTTCTRQNVTHLRALTQFPEKIYLNYHGIDLSRFEDSGVVKSTSDGSKPSAPVTLLSVGRAVEKKGYHELLDGLAKLDAQLNWLFIHIGGGPLLDQLKQQAAARGLTDKCHWLGAQSQQAVIDHYRSADIFVLNSRIDQHGDRDGLPNVIVEAQSQGLPVVSTTISGIPELIEHNINGMLHDPDDMNGLVHSLSTLITQPTQRCEMGAAGRKIVLEKFEMLASFGALEQLLNKLTGRLSIYK